MGVCGTATRPDQSQHEAPRFRRTSGLRDPAARRRRRRRRLLIAAPFIVLVSWAMVSYTVWMVQPTSMAFGARMPSG